MYSNNKLVLHLLSLMKQFEIRKIVVSPGSRHYPIVRSMENDNFFELFSVVDERSAAFFALGLIQKSREPVAVCCTSGTSAVNYGSAVVEAFYQSLPLVVLTADRLPELLNQKEEQMIKQDTVYSGFIRYHGQLREVKDGFMEWYCNRIINEAFLELDHYGRGPVHLNIPIESHHTDKFEVKTLPHVRKIERVTGDADIKTWRNYAQKLSKSRVLIIWGQSDPMPDELRLAIDSFSEKLECVILTDKLSNCHHSMSIEYAFPIFRTLTQNEKSQLAPDVVITLFGNYIFNGDVKRFIGSYAKDCEHWDIGRSDVVDPFQKLTAIFEMRESFFFSRIAAFVEGSSLSTYANKWNKVNLALETPQVEFSEMYAIGKLLGDLPKGASLQIANSLPVRMSHLFKIDDSINVYCNRGVNGIDGSMSTAVGFAANSEQPVFLIIGDLSFFYDMNALWNRHLSRNIRILLLNNEGGGVMHLPLKSDLAPQLSLHVSAGHTTSARGWVESLGIEYISVSNKDDCDIAIQKLTDPTLNVPMLVEIFTSKDEDVKIYKRYTASLNRETLKDKVLNKLKNKLKTKII